MGKLTTMVAALAMAATAAGCATNMMTFNAQETQAERIEEDLYRSAVAQFNGGNYGSAYHAMESFIARHPSSAHVREAIAYEFESARKMIEIGSPETFLGIPLGRSPSRGIESLKSALIRHPFEESSDDCYLWLGNYHYKNGDLPEAAVEYELLVRNYPTSECLPAAVYQLGQCNLYQFDAIYYDSTSLKNARRYYQRIVDEFPGDERYANAQKRLHFIDDKLAEKELSIGEFYISRGKPKSAAVYLKSVVANYPNTSSAARAAEILKSLDTREEAGK